MNSKWNNQKIDLNIFIRMSDQIVTCEIKNFSEFLDKCLNRNVIGYTMKPLTKAGDNYGSVLHSVELEVTGSGCCDKVNVYGFVF